MSEELKACPFCGAAAHATPEHRPTRIAEHVMCLGCGAELDGLGSIEQWNTRAQAQAAPEAEPVALKSHGAWDGLDDLDGLPDGARLYTAPQHDAELVELLRGVQDLGITKTNSWHELDDLLARIDAKLATLSAKP